MTKKILYLSGAPRVSTNSQAKTSGPRAHILGFISAFEKTGFKVSQFIVGDRYKYNFSNSSSEKLLFRLAPFRIAADIFRLLFAILNEIIVYTKYGRDFDFCYERFGAYQSLGRALKAKGVTWIVETNSPLFEEANEERKSIFFVNYCKRKEIEVYKQCDYIVCVTNELKNILITKLQIEQDKIIVIKNGVDAVRFAPKLHKINVRETFTIGFVGILATWCGVDLLIEALNILVNERNIKHVYCKIIGDGVLKNSLVKLTEDYNLNNYISFEGHLAWDNIPSRISEFDFGYSGQVNMKSNKMYHSPLKLYEYMSMGVPVIASNFQDASELIQSGRNGVLFEHGNVESLVEAIGYCINHNDFQSAIKIREDIITNHSWENRIEILLNHIHLNGNKD